VFNLPIDTIIPGNTLSVLNTLPSESIDCVITSPPYWGLRDYGVDSQLGLEPTFNEYITNLQTIFDEVYRVLKKTGTCWVDIGDTYASNGNGSIPTKSLCNIPFRFAISMTDNGWIQRNTIIWHKPSCMPSSAKDRFTVDFEYVFFFTKNKKYYFEQQFDAYADITLLQKGQDYRGKDTKNYEGVVPNNTPYHPGDIKRRVIKALDNNIGRNRRTVWRINPHHSKDAHFAVFPEKLVEPMVKAGCPSVGTVLDPFVGTGTTALVARKLGRHYIGIDLNEDYVTMANKRLSEVL